MPHIWRALPAQHAPCLTCAGVWILCVLASPVCNADGDIKLLSRIFVTVASWRGKIQADAKAKAEASANVDKLKTGGEAKRAKRSKKAKRPHLNDKNASPTTLSNSCEAHPRTTTSMHELNLAGELKRVPVQESLGFAAPCLCFIPCRTYGAHYRRNKARPSIFEIAPVHTNDTRPQSLSAASNQPARSLDEIFGLAGSRNINTDGVSAALINKLAKATLSVEHLCMDAAQAPSNWRVLMRSVVLLHTQATLALATAAETSASIPPIDDKINTPLDDDLAESHIGGEVGVTEVAVEQPLVADNTDVIQAASIPISVPSSAVAMLRAGTPQNTIDAKNLLVADSTGVIQATSTPDSVPCGVLALNITTALENTIDAKNLLVADGTGVIQAASIPDSVPCGMPALNIATALKNTIDAENLLVANGAGVIQAASIPDSVPCGVLALNIATALENTIDAKNLLVADGTGVIQAASIPISVPSSAVAMLRAGMPQNTIDAENLLVADGTGVIQATSTPDSVPCGVPALNIATALENTIDTKNLLVADGTGMIQAASIPDSVPCSVPLFNVAALEASNSPENESSASDAASIPALKECRRDMPVRPDVIIPVAKPEMETMPHDEAGIPAIQGSAATPTRGLTPDWTYANTIKLIRGSIDQFMVEMDKPSDSLRPEFWKPPGAPMPQGPLATANCDGAVQPADQILFEKAYALLVAALCPAIVDKCRPVSKPNSKEKRKQPEAGKRNQAITPLRRAAQHATHTNFTRKPESRLATAFKYLRPAYLLIVVPFDPKDDEKPAAPLPVSLTDYGKFLAQHGAVEEPSEPELNEAMLDASHEYHEFVACCFAELCDAIFSNSNNPQEQRAIIDEQLGRFWVATRKKSRVCEFKKSLYKMVPNPPTDRNGAETGGGCPCRN
ncbi:hypothetical protein HK105_209361 [Polyrhizophydium stewartii]|uniref:Uncharacterized protein n=1 Tax=Polyrhizophydium stewartii TaxID=2732419 RepID=A0ABR4MV87_9FUNG